LNETLINFFGKGIDGKVGPSTSFSLNTHNHCQLYRSKEHTTSACPKLVDTRPKCAKCRSGHKTKIFGLKCSFSFGLRYMEKRCWKKSAKGLPTITIFLEVLTDDEEVTLAKLYCVCGKDQHIFYGMKIP